MFDMSPVNVSSGVKLSHNFGGYCLSGVYGSFGAYTVKSGLFVIAL
jgi:hypothetical protein